jgi:surface protein
MENKEEKKRKEFLFDNVSIRETIYLFRKDSEACKQKFGNMQFWITTNVTDMGDLFKTHKDFNEDISRWDVSNVTNMKEMFAYANAFNQPIGAWNVINVTNMESMFHFAAAFNQPIGAWNVSNVTNMKKMFYYAEALTNLSESVVHGT